MNQTPLDVRLQAALGAAYQLEKELGGGGMSRVFLAEEVRLGRKVVVKVLPPEMAAGVNVERFEREIQLAARLQHPHIVPLLTAGAEGDLLYYVMPYIEGESLRAKLAREGELPVRETVQILKEVLDALKYAHSERVVHRDIKPDNVMLSRGHAVVTDFGVAKAVSESTGESSLTSLGVALGTPAYMSPEQAAADPHVDHRADLYAVGALAYEMLTGRPPFSGANPQAVLAAHITQAPLPVTAHRDSVPPGLNELVLRCLAKKAADRPQRADELLPMLDALLTPSGGTTPAGTQPVTLAAPPAGAAHPVRVAGLFALASVGVLALVRVVVQAVGLPDWVFFGAIALLVAGLPIMLYSSYRERRRAKLALSGVHHPTPVGLTRHMTVRKAAMGGVLAFAGLALIAGGFMVSRVLGVGPGKTLLSSGVLKDQDRVLLADLGNATSDSTIAETVTELLRVGLAQSRSIQLLERTQVGDALERMQRPRDAAVTDEIATEVAARLGLKAFVTGEVRSVGNGFLISARLVEASSGTSLATISQAVDGPGQLIEAVNKLSNALREKIGESLRTVRADPPLESVTASSLEAVRLWAQADKVSAEGDDDRAIALLEQAITIDSGFASAHRRVGMYYRNRGGAAGRDSSRRHLERAYALRDRLSLRERLLVEGSYATIRRDDDAALTAYLSLLEQYPNEPTALNNAGVSLTNLGRIEEAVAMYRRAIAAGVAVAFSYTNLISDLNNLGDAAAADTVLRQFAERYPDARDLAVYQSNLALARQDYLGSETAARALLTGPPALQVSADYRLSEIADARGQRREAERYERQALGINAQRLGWSAEELELNQQMATLSRSFDFRPTDPREVERLWELNQRVTAGRPATGRNYGFFLEAFLRAGQPGRARTTLEEYRRGIASMEGPSVVDRALLLVWDGRVTAGEGRPVEGLQLFRQGCDLIRSRYALCNGHPNEARLYQQAGQADSAIAVMERYFALTAWRAGFVSEQGAQLRSLAEMYEAKGERARAVEVYGRFVDLWKDADPDLQPIVQNARERIAALSREGG
jgi:tetratricopeptide (TPR) repeat protein